MEISGLEDPLSIRGLFFPLFCTTQHWPEFQQYHPEGCNTSWCSESDPPRMILHTGKSPGSAPDKHLYSISHLDSAQSSKPCSRWHKSSLENSFQRISIKGGRVFLVCGGVGGVGCFSSSSCFELLSSASKPQTCGSENL